MAKWVSCWPWSWC